MNIKLLFIALTTSIIFTMSTASCKAQRPILVNVEGIDLNQLKIKKPNGMPINLGDSENLVIQSLGTPNSNQEFEYEMLEKEGSLLKYLNTEIYIMNGRFFSFIFKNNTFSVGLEENYIRIGDDISKVDAMYSKASGFKRDNYYRIQLKSGDIEIEGTFLIVEFDPSTNKITGIGKYEN